MFFVGDGIENLAQDFAQFLASFFASCLVQPEAFLVVGAVASGALGTRAVEVFQALSVIIEGMPQHISNRTLELISALCSMLVDCQGQLLSHSIH